MVLFRIQQLKVYDASICTVNRSSNVSRPLHIFINTYVGVIWGFQNSWNRCIRHHRSTWIDRRITRVTTVALQPQVTDAVDLRGFYQCIYCGQNIEFLELMDVLCALHNMTHIINTSPHGLNRERHSHCIHVIARLPFLVNQVTVHTIVTIVCARALIWVSIDYMCVCSGVHAF